MKKSESFFTNFEFGITKHVAQAADKTKVSLVVLCLSCSSKCLATWSSAEKAYW